MSLTVTLHAFSGMPNPTWRLDASQTIEFVRRLRDLTETPTDGPALPDLGYRGIQCLATEMTDLLADSLHVFGGRVEGATSSWRDPGRALERWLLDSAGEALTPEARAMVEAELRGA